MNIFIKLLLSLAVFACIGLGESVAAPLAQLGMTAMHAIAIMGMLFLLFITKPIPPFLRLMALAGYLTVFGTSMVLLEIPAHVHTNILAALGGTLLALSLYPKLPGER